MNYELLLLYLLGVFVAQYFLSELYGEEEKNPPVILFALGVTFWPVSAIVLFFLGIYCINQINEGE